MAFKENVFQGAWLPNFDPMELGEKNYKTLQNYRYTDGGIEPVAGYSQVSGPNTPFLDKYTVTAGGDDGFANTATAALQSAANYAWTGHLGAGVKAKSYYIFKDIDIPKDSTITNAFLYLTCALTATMSTVYVTLAFEDVGSATQPSSANNLFNKTLTTNQTSWVNVKPWTASKVYTSPSIGPSLEEVVGRADWSAKNDVCLIMQDTTSPADADAAYRYISTFDGGSPPYLCIGWE